MNFKACLLKTLSFSLLLFVTPKVFAEKDSTEVSFLEQPNEPPMMAPVSHPELYMSYAILVFGVVILVVLTYIVLKKDTHALSDFFRYVVTILIVVSCLFLITAGYSSQQIAPVIGLLGTIVGYLLGSKESKNQ